LEQGKVPLLVLFAALGKNTQIQDSCEPFISVLILKTEVLQDKNSAMFSLGL
jgi:hypothetical protein